MTEPGGVDRKKVIHEALVLGIGRSPVARIVSVDLVRSALEMNLDDIVVGDRVNLDVVWKTLEPLPGFDAKSAMPAFAWLKQQEGKIGLKIELPPAMGKLASQELANLAAMCPIKPRELDHVMDGFTAPAPGEITAPVVMPPDTPPKKPTRPPVLEAPAPARPSRRRALRVIAPIAAALALAFMSVTLYRSCDSSVKFKKLSGEDFATMPVRDPRLLGTQVGVTLTDPSWVGRPEADRRRQMTEILQRLERRGVSVFYVQDAAKKTVASAQWRGREVVVMFY